MNLQELKAALVLLQQEDPQFLADLVGAVVKENLSIERQQQDYSDVGPASPELRWKEKGNDYPHAFSYM